MSGGDFISRSEAAVFHRRRIDDRITVVRDLRRVVKHLGEAVAGDQLGLAPGDANRIEARKMAVSPALLTAMYGPGGSQLLPALAPEATMAVGVAKIMAACSGRPVANVAAPVAISTAPAAKPTPAEAEALHATLQRAVKVTGSTKQAALAIGIGWSTIGFLLGKKKPITAATAEKVRAWAAANPISNSPDAVVVQAAVAPALPPAPAADAGDATTDRGAADALPPPPAPDPAAASMPPTEPPTVDVVNPGAVAGGPAEPEVVQPAPTVAGDPVAAAVAVLQAEAEAAKRVYSDLNAQIVAIDDDIRMLKARRAGLDAHQATVCKRWDTVTAAVKKLGEVAA